MDPTTKFSIHTSWRIHLRHLHQFTSPQMMKDRATCTRRLFLGGWVNENNIMIIPDLRI